MQQSTEDVKVWVSVEMRYSTLARVQQRADEKGRKPGSLLSALIEASYGDRKPRRHRRRRGQLALFESAA